MNSTTIPLLAAFLGLLVLFVAGIFLGIALGRRAGRLEAEKDLPDRLEAERDDAVRRSRAVVGGQVAEQLAPYLPDFPCDPGDARFVGKPIDFVCFSGASRGISGVAEGDGEGAAGGAAAGAAQGVAAGAVSGGLVSEIVFVEVKTGSSGLSKIERSVRDAIVAGNVRWVEYRIPTD